MKLAFIHIMRTGGGTVHYHLTELLPPQGYRVFSSWETLQRDYSVEELIEISKCEGNVYVHDHVNSWNESLVDHFHSLGWSLFTFIRPLGDLLCSLYFFHEKRFAELGSLGTLDDWMRLALTDPNWTCLYEIPEYWRKIDQIWRYSEENIRQFLSEILGFVPEELWHIHPTASRGYNHYRKAKLISDNTDMLMINSPAFLRYKEVYPSARGQVCIKCHL